MPSKEEELFAQLWYNINSFMSDGVISSEILRSELHPDWGFADTGEALKRLLALGASKRDLALLMRDGCYAGTFATLYAVQDFEKEELRALHEGLSSADPSGLEGRPGSAPAMRPKEEA